MKVQSKQSALTLVAKHRTHMSGMWLYGTRHLSQNLGETEIQLSH